MRYLVLLAFLGGCATTGGVDMSKLNGEQLKAMVADKNFTAICSNLAGTGGAGKFVYVNIDKTVVTNGAISVTPDCTVTMSNAPNPPRLDTSKKEAP
jgi:hypothetical protein